MRSDHAAHCVSQGLKAGHSFKESELSEVQSSAAAFEELVIALTSSASLTRLSLTECGLGDEGVASVLPAVRSNTAVMVELRSNRIANHGAGLLAEALAGNHTLRTLDLQRNDVKCQGAIGLAAALQVCVCAASLSRSARCE